MNIPVDFALLLRSLVLVLVVVLVVMVVAREDPKLSYLLLPVT